jgi:hypothetical protein
VPLGLTRQRAPIDELEALAAGGVVVAPIASTNVSSGRPTVNVKELIRVPGVCIYNRGERGTRRSFTRGGDPMAKGTGMRKEKKKPKKKKK